MHRNFKKYMKILDAIRQFFRFGQVLSWNNLRTRFADWGLAHYKFASLIWYNICDILTDLIEDVQLIDKSGAQPLSPAGEKFAMFRAFMFAWGKVVLQRLFDDGFIIIGFDPRITRFWVLDENEYIREHEENLTVVQPKDPNVQICVLKSATFVMYERSDRNICHGFLCFLDDVLNGSATVSKRLGAVVVASPKNLNSAPTATVLTDEQKKKLEQEMREDYGALSNQSNIMILPREMSWQTINLAGLDLKMQDKVKTAILAIVDRIKVPANQVAIIDANTNKSLANGGEIREGDKLKYKSFRRLFERTFGDLARYYGLQIDYIINGEPIGESAEITV